MKSLLKIFRPAPHIAEISDPEKVKSEYKYWRYRILYSMFIGYAFYYFSRLSFNSAMPGLINDLHFDKSQLGFLTSMLSITYGMSKFASGVLSDQSNPRYFMAVGLVLTGVFNIFFGMSSTLLMFAIFWGLNGWFQGFGWPPCARFLTHWYSHSERGSWWATWNVSHNVGSFLIPWIVVITMYYFGWRYAMFVPGILCIFGGLFLVNRLRDTPQSLGLPPIEKYRNDYPSTPGEEKDRERELNTKELLYDVIGNKYIWMLAFAYFFVYLIRMGMNTWTVLFLMESKNYSLLTANACFSLFEVGGFFGSLFAGWSSDKLFKAKRGPVNVLFSIGVAIGILAFWYAPAGYPFIDSAAIFLIGFTVFGPQMLIGMAAAELSHKKAAATASGFVGWIAYLGAAVAGYPLGFIIDHSSWEGLFWALAGCSVTAVCLLMPLWNVTERPVKKAEEKLPVGNVVLEE